MPHVARVHTAHTLTRVSGAIPDAQVGCHRDDPDHHNCRQPHRRHRHRRHLLCRPRHRHRHLGPSPSPRPWPLPLPLPPPLWQHGQPLSAAAAPPAATRATSAALPQRWTRIAQGMLDPLPRVGAPYRVVTNRDFGRLRSQSRVHPPVTHAETGKSRL